jgi:hypothetical protein
MSNLPDNVKGRTSAWLLPIIEAITAVYTAKKAKEEINKCCTVCGVPLILKSEDTEGVFKDEPEIYEDDCEGMCGSCHMYPKGTGKF